MHLAFIDIEDGYLADRPDTGEAFGGTGTAVCFLARELVKAGHACTFFNKVEKPGEAHGIRSLPLEALVEERANPAYDAFIFCGRWVEWLVKLVHEKAAAPLVVWMHLSTFDPGLKPLMPGYFKGIIFVSEWQKNLNRDLIPPHWKQVVIRNAMNERFAGLFPPGAPILAAKTRPPVLVYAGATPRGAIYLPEILGHLRKRRADFTMEIYCNCQPTRDPALNAGFMAMMRALPGVTHVGMVGQVDLAERMKKAAILVSPNPCSETSCIILMEAMAAGMQVVATNRAVLPETAGGFAHHIAIADAGHATRFDMPMPCEDFAAAIDESITAWLREPEAVERKLRKQIDFFTARYRWSQRAEPMRAFLESLSAG